MLVRYMNLSVTSKKERMQFLKRFDELLAAGVFIMGEEVVSFEEKVAKFCSSKYCIGVGSGTDAIILSLMAYDIKAGDEVIIPDMSFVATANAVAMVGAKAIFCDVKDDFNINVSKIESLISDKTKAIIPVHYGGKIVKDIDKLLDIANKHNLKVIEDASQAFGSQKNNKMAGTFGEIGAISLNPMKTLGGFGEAGVVLTDSKKIYHKIKALRYNGLNEKKKCIYKSFNGKIDTIQASFLSIKMDKLNFINEKREKVFTYYNKHLKEFAITPQIAKNEKTSYYSYTLLVDKKYRDDLFKYLLENSVEAKINHLSIHKEKAYKRKGIKLKNSLKLSKMKISLPCHEKMKTSEVKFVVNIIKDFFDKKKYI